MFSCEYCKMFKDTCFKEQLRMAALASHTEVPPEGPTLGTHLKVLDPTFPVYRGEQLLLCRLFY